MTQKKLAYILITVASLFLALEIFSFTDIPESNTNPDYKKLMARIENMESENQKLQKELRSVKLASDSEIRKDDIIVETVKNVRDSVVSIVASRDLTIYKQNYRGYYDPFWDRFYMQKPETEQRRVKIGGGSGFIYSEDGYVITNKHVIADDDANYTVILFDGTEMPAQVIAKDPYNDVAIIKVNPADSENPLHPITLGKSGELEVGERVIAIGNALAEFQNTVTTGVISAVNRNITASTGQSQPEQISNLLQTDAAINPGNSGGPLLNIFGEVIGVNTAVAQGAEGIGFAIPIDDIKVVAESVKKHGRIVRPYMGIRYMPLNKKIGEALDLKATEGAYIQGSDEGNQPAVMPESPADQAGLREGDIIVSIDNTKITPDLDLRQIVQGKDIGNKISVEILREGKRQKLTLRLREMP